MNLILHASLPGAVLLAIVAALPGCANQPPEPQTIEIRVVADDPAWAGPLACEAANSAGKWPFSAPGSVIVLPSFGALEITCSPAGVLAESSVTAPGRIAAGEHYKKGATTGALVGAGAGIAAGAAAAPIAGPAMIVLFAAGAAAQGAGIGGIVGTATSGEKPQYPSTIVLHIKAAPPGGDK
ncbi:MAG TPA: hypothetical protein VLW55_00280 [Burkholderiaceae bacterium]|nr:hypothetical protein [Burkholderiaceae bacterium]